MIWGEDIFKIAVFSHRKACLEKKNQKSAFLSKPKKKTGDALKFLYFKNNWRLQVQKADNIFDDNWNVAEAYRRYKANESTALYNERVRPQNQDIFAWLLEDEKLATETDNDLKKAGL